MKKCVNCGGNNSETEIYCDWCGEKLLPERKMTLLLALKYYFHSFAILGIIVAIIFYISSFLSNPQNLDILNRTLLGISLELILQFGLFVCFCFFILLLILLAIEISSIKKRDFSLKFLMLILIGLLVFASSLFILVGQNWISIIILSITAIFIYLVYIHILDIFVINEIHESIKSRNLLVITSLSVVIFILFVTLSSWLTFIVNYISQVPLPNEEKPLLLNQIFNGFFVGILFGIILGTVTCAIYMIINGTKITANELKSFFRKQH